MNTRLKHLWEQTAVKIGTVKKNLKFGHDGSWVGDGLGYLVNPCLSSILTSLFLLSNIYPQAKVTSVSPKLEIQILPNR